MESVDDGGQEARAVSRAAILRVLRINGLNDACGLVAFAVAFVLRRAVDDVLPPGLPYPTFFPAVIVTTFLGGLRPGITCATLSGLAAWYFFLPPLYSFAVTPQVALALAFYVFVVAIDITLIHLMARAGERLRTERAVTDGLYEQQRTMFQELQHRVANNMQFVGTLLAMQRRKVERDPASGVAALVAAEDRLYAFADLNRRLYDPAMVDRPVGETLRALCADLLEGSSKRGVAVVVEAEDVQLDLTQLTTLSLLVVEVVTSALKHAFPCDRVGMVRVTLEPRNASRVFLRISDDGCGLPSGVDPEVSRSLGFRISQSLAAQLGGRLSWASGTEGTSVALDFMVAPQAAAHSPVAHP